MRYRNNPFARKTIWLALGASTLAVAFLTGCPSLRVAQVDLVPESLTAQTFTLSAQVQVTEEDPAVDDEGNLGGGRGVLGVWLPPGWQVTGARLIGPEDTSHIELTAIEDAAGHFPPPFPFVPGSWFAFVSACNNIDEGIFDYAAEIDVEGDGSSTAVTLGISTALFNDEGSNGPVPTEVAVDLEAGTAEVRQPPAAPAPAGLVQCESIPYEDTSAESGCACSHPGVSIRQGSRFSLLGILSTVL
jgi:hypothetical protein